MSSKAERLVTAGPVAADESFDSIPGRHEPLDPERAAMTATDPIAAAVWAQIEDLTPTEALYVLRPIVAGLRAEVREFNREDHTS